MNKTRGWDDDDDDADDDDDDDDNDDDDDVTELGLPDHDGGPGVLLAVPRLVPLPGLSLRHVLLLRHHHDPAHVRVIVPL